MTACVNRKHTKKVAAVVTASLVGALSLGVAPVAAMATEGIDMQLASGDEFTNGTVASLGFETFNGTDWVDVGDSFIGEDENGVTTVNPNQLPIRPDITGIKIAVGEKTETVTSATVSNYKVRLYKADEKGEPSGTPLSGNKAIDAGEYVVTITALSGSAYEGQTFKTNFIVENMELPDLTAFENGDKTDTTFTFTGSALKVGFMDSGTSEALKEGVDYTVAYKIGSKTYDEIVDAGEYTAIITGIGKYAGSSASTLVNVKHFGLDSADVHIEVEPYTDGNMPTTPSRVWFQQDANHITELDPSLVTITPQPGVTTNDPSETPYVFNVSVDKAEEAAGNLKPGVTYNTTVDVYKVDVLCDFWYGKAALEDSYVIDASTDDAFDLTDITATYGSKKAAHQTITVERVSGTAVGAGAKTDLMNNEVGEYRVTVPVAADTDADGTVYAGSKTFTVKVYAGSVDADASLYVYGPDYYDPNVSPVAITSYAKGYDGEQLVAGSFYISGKDAQGNKIDTTKLDVKLVDAEGNEVDEAVDAGEYKLVITSDVYLLSGTTELPITIGKVDLTTLKIGELKKWNSIAGQEYLPNDKDYVVNAVDSAITALGLRYDTGNGSEETYTPDNYVGLDELPGNVDIDVEYNDEGTWKPVGKIEKGASGSYRLIVTVAADVASNYVLPEGETSVTIEFTVAEKTVFSDVQPDMWYYKAVIRAARNGYVHGDAGLTTFRPEATITRGEVAVVLYNMSGMSRWWGDNENNSGSYVEGQGWKTGFDDVDGTAFYAEAIAWAKKTGVVNGDAGTNNFRPDATVTSEEFAAMLANYAEKVNQDKTVAEADAASLEGVKGAEGVSEWAQKSVAWAVESEIMGNNGADLDAKGSIQRARVAAMAVNYQPNAKDTNL